jgi:hypothetical protein
MRCGRYLPGVCHTCHRYKRNYLFSTSWFAFSRLHHWFIFPDASGQAIQLHQYSPTGIKVPVFPYRSPHTGFPKYAAQGLTVSTAELQFDGWSPDASGPSEGLFIGCPIVLHPFQSIHPQGADSSHTRFAATRRAGDSPQMLIKSTKVSFTTNLSLVHKSPPFG